MTARLRTAVIFLISALLLYTPLAFWRLYYSGRLIRIDGRTLHPRAQAYLKLMSIMAPKDMPSPKVYREIYTKGNKLFGGPAVPIHLVKTAEITLNKQPQRIRVYDADPCSEAKPGILFFHGGGFVIGSIDSHDAFCRRLARDTGRRVLSLEYRKGPEYILPAAFDDATAAWDYLASHAETWGLLPDDIAICGDSAGAALTLAAGKHAANAAIKPSALIAIYPPELSMAETDSKKRLLNENLVLTRRVVDWFSANVTDASTDFSDERYALSDTPLAKTYVLTCGFDPLRDEGEDVVRQLRAVGTDVIHEEKSDLFHNYIVLAGLFPDVDKTAISIANFLKYMPEEKTILKTKA